VTTMSAPLNRAIGTALMLLAVGFLVALAL
jgi:hypothetical protein